jgi:hypothetical protein
VPARAPTFSIRAVAQLLPVWRKCGTDQLFSSTPTGSAEAGRLVSSSSSANENQSWYLEENILAHTTDSKGVDRTPSHPITTAEMAGTIVGTGFVDDSVKWSSNGYL